MTSVFPSAFVIGHPVAHSRSPLIHGHWLAQYGLAGRYEKIDVPPDALADFIGGLAAAGFAGGNVTVPHKAAMLGLVDEVDPAGRAIGAVNTLWFDGGRLVAGNTDAIGFLGSLDAEAPGWDRNPGRALLLGAGGAARAIVYGLLQRGFAVDLVNRSMERAEALSRDFGGSVAAYGWTDTTRRLPEAGLVINTTSLGMAGMPHLDLDLGPLRSGALVCDIVYVPKETALLRQAQSRGLRRIGGLGMLLHQAVPGFERWFGRRPDVTAALRAVIEANIAGL